ncbi:nucleotidyltransferase domain-containing protein [Microvirga arabica]|uniref:Nucleotidyltransferase domain-containing protein n=1 Tax=Microvirga arabica TaxID=1128671 RepID=A0ABV6YDG8_9HYPH
MNSGKLIGAYVFGSVGRGQHDSLSDLDVLAVVENGSGKVDEALVASLIPDDLTPLKLSISWYGRNRLREMFQNGELFAWHLHQETIPLFDPHQFLKALGQPNHYRDCLADVASFQKVLSEIPLQVSRNESNAVYEAGLIYVCLRNIAMAASWALCEKPDFSRYSAFRLRGYYPCPISLSEFELTMSCRMAGQRGLDPPKGVDRSFVLDLFERLEHWVQGLTIALQREALHGR